MRIILKQLFLTNFKGLTVHLKLNGQDANIYGDNATGKTTIYDSICWLLFDRDSQFGKGMEIKNLDSAGNAVHNLEHVVQGLFDVDGNELLLRKVYTEKYSKKRGHAEQGFSGHTTDHFVDGVPVSKKEYQDRVGQVATEDEFKLLTSPAYFAEVMPWQQRRQTLLEVGGGINDQAVIASNEELQALPGILGKHTIEDYRKTLTARRKEVNQQLDQVPVKINEASRDLPDIKGIDVVAESAKTNDLGLTLDRLYKKKASLEGTGGLAEKEAELTEAKANLTKANDDHFVAVTAKIREAEERQSKKTNEINANLHDISDMERGISIMLEDVADTEAKVEALKAQWYAEDGKQFTPPADESICPHCGQEVPAEIREASINQAKANFEKQKTAAQERIVLEGKPLKASIAAVTYCITSSMEALKAKKEIGGWLHTEQTDIMVEIVKLKQQRDTAATTTPDIERIEAEVVALKESGPAAEIAKVDAEIEATNTALAEIGARIELVNQATKAQERVKELEAEQKELARAYEQIERELYLLEQFDRAKAAMLNEQINGHFSLVRFKLFKENINGGTEPCCEVMVNGVPYTGNLNNAARIQAGLDIIKTLSRHYGKVAPIVIDNSESVTSLPDMDSQVIRLIVSEPDKALRVECVNDTLKEAA